MVGYWSNFAKKRGTNGAGLPEWPRFWADDPAVQSLVPRITSRFDFSGETQMRRLEPDHQCELAAALTPRRYQFALTLARSFGRKRMSSLCGEVAAEVSVPHLERDNPAPVRPHCMPNSAS